MRVIVLTQWFDPEPAPKGYGFAKAIAAAGNEVEVVTGFPNYPGGKIYPGFRMRWRHQVSANGVTVTRLPLYPSHSESRLGRVLNYASFFVTSMAHLLFGARRADVIYCYHPPLTSGLAAALASRVRGIPLVYDIQDMWPDTLAATGMVRNQTLLNLVGRLCLLVYRQASAITVLSQGFKRVLIERGVPADKISVVINWCEEEKILASPAGMTPELSGDGFIVLFAGTMGRAQALDAVIGAARIVQEQEPIVRFVFIGGGVDVPRLREVAGDATNVVFLPPVPMDQVAAYLTNADALLVHLRKDPLFEITIPSKTQAYMATGKPLIMAVRGDAATLVEESASGVVAQPEDERSIADAVLKLVQMPPAERAAMGARAREYYRSNLSMDVGIGKYVELFKELTGVPLER